MSYEYFLEKKALYPEIFSQIISGSCSVEECVQSFNYSNAVIDWFLIDGDNTLRIDYPIASDSVIFDVGGYIGDWSDMIKFENPYIHIFEPNPESFAVLQSKYQNEEKITLYNIGLANETKFATLGMFGMGSRIYPYNTGGVSTVEVQLKDIQEVINDLNLVEIDLIKINIEGGEYALLQRLIQTGLINLCKNILIQFHEWYPDAETLRENIRTELALTHNLSWNYNFVWESWERK